MHLNFKLWLEGQHVSNFIKENPLAKEIYNWVKLQPEVISLQDWFDSQNSMNEMLPNQPCILKLNLGGKTKRIPVQIVRKTEYNDGVLLRKQDGSDFAELETLEPIYPLRKGSQIDKTVIELPFTILHINAKLLKSKDDLIIPKSLAKVLFDSEDNQNYQNNFRNIWPLFLKSIRNKNPLENIEKLKNIQKIKVNHKIKGLDKFSFQDMEHHGYEVIIECPNGYFWLRTKYIGNDFECRLINNHQQPILSVFIDKNYIIEDVNYDTDENFVDNISRECLKILIMSDYVRGCVPEVLPGKFKDSEFRAMIKEKPSLLNNLSKPVMLATQFGDTPESKKAGREKMLQIYPILSKIPIIDAVFQENEPRFITSLQGISPIDMSGVMNKLGREYLDDDVDHFLKPFNYQRFFEHIIPMEQKQQLLSFLKNTVSTEKLNSPDIKSHDYPRKMGETSRQHSAKLEDYILFKLLFKEHKDLIPEFNIYKMKALEKCVRNYFLKKNQIIEFGEMGSLRLYLKNFNDKNISYQVYINEEAIANIQQKYDELNKKYLDDEEKSFFLKKDFIEDFEMYGTNDPKSPQHPIQKINQTITEKTFNGFMISKIAHSSVMFDENFSILCLQEAICQIINLISKKTQG